jgi:hypothetical protein
MINLTRAQTTNTIAIYPESASIYYNDPSGSFEIQVSQDYNRNTGSITPLILNVPSAFSPRLVFEILGTELPEESGLYTYTLQEFLSTTNTWIEQNTLWFLTDLQWSTGKDKSTERNLDIDRLAVSGSDTPSFNQYVSPEETGYYTTYGN